MANKAVRTNVAACRLTDAQWESITKKLEANKISGASSPGLLARKLLLDWDDGELRFKTKGRETMTREVFEAHQALKGKRNGAPKVAAVPAPSAG